MSTRRRSTARSQANHQRLIETALTMFAERGYEKTSVKDVGEAVGLTTGTIYSHFHNKAELLAAAVSAAIASQLEQTQNPGSPEAVIDGTSNLFGRYPSQSVLRGLLLDGAMAARSDETVRDRLRQVQLDRMAAWTAIVRRHQDSGHLDPSFDVEIWVKLIWALEFGLVIFDVFGIDPPDPERTGALVRRLLDALRPESG